MTIQFVAAVQMTRHDTLEDLNEKFACLDKKKEEELIYGKCVLNHVTISEKHLHEKLLDI